MNFTPFVFCFFFGSPVVSVYALVPPFVYQPSLANVQNTTHSRPILFALSIEFNNLMNNFNLNSTVTSVLLFFDSLHIFTISIINICRCIFNSIAAELSVLGLDMESIHSLQFGAGFNEGLQRHLDRGFTQIRINRDHQFQPCSSTS